MSEPVAGTSPTSEAQDNPRLARIRATLDKRQPDLTVFMDNVHKPHNLAAIVRTCDAVGIGEVHGVFPPGTRFSCNHTASGSGRWVESRRHPDLQTGIAGLKAGGMQVLAAHLSDAAVDFRAIDYTLPTCILVGAEKYGVSEEAAAVADHHILIPMMGMVQSLNVSVATALVLYEAERQRQNAGLYNQVRITDAEYRRHVFEWLHPKVADWCRRKGHDYPHLNDQGDIDDPDWQRMRQGPAQG